MGCMLLFTSRVAAHRPVAISIGRIQRAVVFVVLPHLRSHPQYHCNHNHSYRFQQKKQTRTLRENKTASAAKYSRYAYQTCFKMHTWTNHTHLSTTLPLRPTPPDTYQLIGERNVRNQHFANESLQCLHRCACMHD